MRASPTSAAAAGAAPGGCDGGGGKWRQLGEGVAPPWGVETLQEMEDDGATAPLREVVGTAAAARPRAGKRGHRALARALGVVVPPGRAAWASAAGRQA
jgi:hypothetical protein